MPGIAKRVYEAVALGKFGSNRFVFKALLIFHH